MDYEALAIDLARSRAALAAGITEPSHWNFYDELPDRHGIVTAVCGAKVKETRISGDPTCVTCQEVLEAIQAQEI